MAVNMCTWCVAFVLTVIPCIFASTNSNGFGDNIDWQTFEDGLEKSTTTGKPLMLIIHKSWCGACKALKPKFSTSKEIEALSSKFVMVNVQDDEEPKDSKYVPDGGYIPRILFLNSAGEVQTELINEQGNRQYKYYYPDANGVLATMQEAVKRLTTTGTDEL